jgi:hypothetical protein
VGAVAHADGEAVTQLEHEPPGKDRLPYSGERSAP